MCFKNIHIQLVKLFSMKVKILCHSSISVKNQRLVCKEKINNVETIF